MCTCTGQLLLVRLRSCLVPSWSHRHCKDMRACVCVCVCNCKLFVYELQVSAKCSIRIFLLGKPSLRCLLGLGITHDDWLKPGVARLLRRGIDILNSKYMWRVLPKKCELPTDELCSENFNANMWSGESDCPTRISQRKFDFPEEKSRLMGAGGLSWWILVD